MPNSITRNNVKFTALDTNLDPWQNKLPIQLALVWPKKQLGAHLELVFKDLLVLQVPQSNT